MGLLRFQNTNRTKKTLFQFDTSFVTCPVSSSQKTSKASLFSSITLLLQRKLSDIFALSIPSNPQSRFQSPQIPQIWESKPLLPVLLVELDSHCPFSSRHALSSLSYLCTMLSTPQVLLPISRTSPLLPKLLATYQRMMEQRLL